MNTSISDRSDPEIRRALVSENPITRRLVADGWRAEDLDKIVLPPCDRSRPFMQWPFRPTHGQTFPKGEPRRLRAHAALKVLMMDDLPFSAGEQEAWAFIRSVALEMAEDAYLAYGEAQQARASGQRATLAADGAVVPKVIARLATNPEHLNLPPRLLWPHFFAALDGCDPIWKNQDAQHRDWIVEYDAKASEPETGEAERKSVGYQHFCRLVRAARKAKKRH